MDIRRGGVFDNAQKWKAPDAAPALSIGREIMRKGKKKRKILTFVCGGGEGRRCGVKVSSTFT